MYGLFTVCVCFVLIRFIDKTQHEKPLKNRMCDVYVEFGRVRATSEDGIEAVVVVVFARPRCRSACRRALDVRTGLDRSGGCRRPESHVNVTRAVPIQAESQRSAAVFQIEHVVCAHVQSGPVLEDELLQLGRRDYVVSYRRRSCPQRVHEFVRFVVDHRLHTLLGPLHLNVEPHAGPTGIRYLYPDQF